MMGEDRYILRIQNKQVYKEVAVGSEMTMLRIGTTQECDVRLKRDLFGRSVVVTMCLIGKEWRISCEDGLQLSSKSVKSCGESVIKQGDILRLHGEDSQSYLLTFMLDDDYANDQQVYDMIVDIRNVDELVIGDHMSAQLKLQSKYVKGQYLSLRKASEGMYLMDAKQAPFSATLNGNRVLDRVEVKEYDFIGLADFQFYYKNGVFYTQERRDLLVFGVQTQPLREETEAFDYPKLNRSPRRLYPRDDESIEVLNPPQKPQKPKTNLVMQLSPALAMIGVTVITRSGLIAGLNGGNPAFLIFSLSTMGVGILTSIMSFIYNNKAYKEELDNWNNDYMAYISRKREEIEAVRLVEYKERVETYPSTESLRDFVKTFSSRLFERSPEDADFLTVRVGSGSTPAYRPIEYHKEEHIKVENELMEIPNQLSEEYRLIGETPVMVNLKQSGSVGVVADKATQYDFFKTLLLEISVLHDYEDVKVVVLLPENSHERFDWIRWLPHLKDAGGSVRGIICDSNSKDHNFEFLYSLMNQRQAEVRDDSQEPPRPHYVVLVLEEYGLRTHPLFRYADEATRLGLSFVYFKEHIENLPHHCREIVRLDGREGELLLKDDKRFYQKFLWEEVNDISIKFVSERLAPVYCEKIALSSRLTANITLFELLNIMAPEDLNLKEKWHRSAVKQSMAAPLGVDVKGSTIFLDLHEKAHGPHGLVAGTTGSGKSEIMQSYILSSAVTFHPYEVAFVIIDFKGGGMANQFDGLPHLIGKITDIDSHEINRSLLSIRAELEKRKRFFAEYGVNHIDQYIEKFKEGTAKVPLPHLILIVDEFAELKAEQPGFMKELISTARVGRSLGIHLILATQKPAGQVNEQIWSNSRFKLCLKVATKEDSNEVLKSPLAAEILEPGRAYMQVGNNEIFTLFQSAYSGASAISDVNGNTREFVLSEVGFGGEKTKVYERKAKRNNDGQKLTQLEALVDYIGEHCKVEKINDLPMICLPPLSDNLVYDETSTPSIQESFIRLGIFDDPANQAQPMLQLNLLEGNVLIIGSAQTGKTTLLQTMIKGIAIKSSPLDTSVYIMDFASKVLRMYEGLNHVGGVITDSDDDAIKNFFKMMLEEVSKRKDMFSERGISSFEAYREMRQGDEERLPHIVIMIDNLSIFKELFLEYEEAMLNICREGLALGISVIATAKQTMGLSYKYMSNFGQRLTLTCTENSEYNTVFDRCQIRPKNIQGRGLVSLDKIVYEYQAYMPFAGDSEVKRLEEVKAFITEMSKTWQGQYARPVPSIPRLLTEEYWQQNQCVFKPYEVPVGLYYKNIEPVAIQLLQVGTIGIYGREGFGSSNLMALIFSHLYNNVFKEPCKAYVIDGYDRKLAPYKSYGFVEEMTIDCGDLEDMVDILSDAAEERMDMLKDGESLEELPLLMLVIRHPQAYAMNTIPKKVVDQLKTLINDARQLKMCYVFANIDNTSDFAVSDMMKLARELDMYYFLDDIADVKLLGANKLSINDLKPFRKPIILSEGYTYSAREGINKIKFMKHEGSEK